MDEQTQSTQGNEISASKKGSMNPMVIIAIIIIVIIGGGIFLFSNKQKATNTVVVPTQTEQAAQPTTAASPSAMAANEKDFTIEGGEFFFKPNTITVKKGDTVKITFKNTGGFHDFVIDEFNVKTQRIGSNQTTTVSFLADKTGSFEYYCSVGQHRQNGMKGTLVVVN